MPRFRSSRFVVAAARSLALGMAIGLWVVIAKVCRLLSA